MWKRKIIDCVNSMMLPLGISIYKYGFDMSAALKRIRHHHFEISSIIDIGASNGKWSKMALKIFHNAKVLAIEPLEERKIDLDQLKKKSNRFNYALCAAGELDNTSATIIVTEDLDGSTVTQSKNLSGKKRDIKISTIDSIVSSNKYKGPYLIKFDTHGYEIPILKGASNILNDTNVIIMEVYNYQITTESLLFFQMVEYLMNLGFRCFDVADPMLRPKDKVFWQMDLFFTRSNDPIFLDKEYH